MIHLKLHTEYTFGRTFAKLSNVIDRLKEIGCTAAGIVDVDSTWGHVHWFKACRAAGIQPLLGVDLIVADDEDDETRMWFLARNTAGLQELYQAASKAHQQTVKTRAGSKPRLYRLDVEGMSADIFKFAGDITDGEWLEDVNAYIDLDPSSRILNASKRAIAAEQKLHTVSTADNAYCREEDRATFELMKGGLKQTPQHILDSLGNQVTAEVIAGLCEGLELPKAPMIHMDGDLEEICREGIRYRGLKWTPEYEERLQYELKLIRLKDYESYFIVVADMVHYAKQHMLVGPSRGSAAGSLVCYVSRITEIDPIPPGLYFERFIDVSRSDLPDIDLDFPDNKRAMVFEYMAEKYGINNVAHIGTVSKYKPRSALIQVCKALNIPPQATGAVKMAMVERVEADARSSNCLEDTFTGTGPGQEFIAMYPNAVAATKIEGHSSHTGVHAAGLLVCNDEITKYATVDSNGNTQVDKGSAEGLGLLKIDVLGLRTLAVLEDSGVDIDWYNLKLDDPATLNIFNDNLLCGIFQFEGDALRSITSSISFESIIEIDAVTALARPGPFIGGVTESYIKRKNGERYQPIHPLVEEHMRSTYGLPVYQEQTLAIVREIGKFDWEETAAIRKAMAKTKGREYFEKFWNKFREGALSQGMDEPKALEVWKLINAMGSWQMNKAHTYSYAVISYWAAYLKAHHPLEFAAANLRNAKDEDSATMLLREMVKEGFEYIAFDLELSAENWSVRDGKLLGGFTSLKGIGEKTAAKFVIARDAGKLTKKNLEKIEKSISVFDDIFPIHTNYARFYDAPTENGVAGNVVNIEDLTEDIPHREERVFIGELIKKNPRNQNEEILIKKRGGKTETRALEFLDLRLRDDTGQIGGRIGRWDYLRIGKDLLENVPEGAQLLVRAAFYNGIRYAFVKKWMRLDVEEER